MNTTLMWATWRERFSRRVPIILLAVVALWGLTGAGMQRAPSDMTIGFALILGAGLVGRDVSSGSLALLLTRPVRRSEYLLSRWFAASLAAGAAGLLELGLQYVLVRARSGAVSGVTLVYDCAEAITLAFGVTAALAFLSTLVRGIGDLGVWLVALLVAALAEPAGAARLGQELHHLLVPHVDWAQALDARPISWFPVVSYFSSVTLFLALAILVLNRKELSYASHA
jgi:hypothetical protein